MRNWRGAGRDQIKIRDLYRSFRSNNCLHLTELENLCALISVAEKELSQIKGLDRKPLNETGGALAEKGFGFFPVSTEGLSFFCRRNYFFC